MREQLIGYLLGALDAIEQAEVEQALNHSPQLRQEMEQLADSLDLLEADAEQYEPPVALATRTCEFVQRQTSVTPTAAMPARPASDQLVSTGRWSLIDLMVAASVCAAAVLLFMPAIAQSRHQASLAHCQNNMRAISTGLTSYSESNQGYLPAIPAEGRFSHAGIYGPILYEQGFVTDANQFFCASRQQAFPPEATMIPTREQLSQAEGRQLAEMVKRMGGDYAYVLGYVENGQLRAVRNQHRTNFAILSDAPNLDGASRNSPNHGGCGQNVLFEDGHISYVSQCQLSCGDNLFLNDSGFAEAGDHIDDSVLGHSCMPPVHMVRVK